MRGLQKDFTPLFRTYLRLISETEHGNDSGTLLYKTKTVPEPTSNNELSTYCEYVGRTVFTMNHPISLLGTEW